MTALLLCSCNKSEMDVEEKKSNKEELSVEITMPPAEEKKSSLKEWYDTEHIATRVEVLDFGVNAAEQIQYQAVSDGSLVEGCGSHFNCSLVTPELSEEEVCKMAEYQLRNFTDSWGENVSQCTVTVKVSGKEKYAYVCRYADKYREKVVLYEGKPEKIKDKEYVSICETDNPTREGEKKAWKELRGSLTVKENGKETFKHPQLKQEITGIIDKAELVLYADAEPEDIIQYALAKANLYLNENIKDEEDMEKVYLGIRIQIKQYGSAKGEEMILLWDEKKEYLKPLGEDAKGNAVFLSVEETVNAIGLE